MNNYILLTKEMIPCNANHKGLSYESVKVLKFKDNEVFYSYEGNLLHHHSRWANIKHFVIKL